MLPLGTIVEPWGEVTGVTFQGGERYYFLSRRGAVALMPAETVDAARAEQRDPQPSRLGGEP